jgi:predicted nucleotidyltransferase
MIKFTKLPDNISQLIPRAVDYLQSRDDVLFAYLFGSLAKGPPVPLSDVDIAIYLSEKKGFSEKKMEMLGKLTDLLETDEVDLVILNTAPLSLEIKILEKKVLLVDKDSFLRHKYESIVMRKYLDFSVMESAVLRRRFLRG